MLVTIKRTLFVVSGGSLEIYFGLRRRLVYFATTGGFYDNKEIKYLKTLVRPGDHILDVGANLGAYAIHFAKWVKDLGTVTCFEPYPKMNKQLGIQLEGLSQVTIRSEALSSKDSDCGVLAVPLLTKSIPEPSLASLETAASEQFQVTITVTTRMLDSLLTIFARPIRLIKIDVEGHEVEVLKGASELIGKDRPFILIEFALLSEKARTELKGLLEVWRYTLWLIQSDGTKLISAPKDWLTIKDYNVILCPNAEMALPRF